MAEQLEGSHFPLIAAHHLSIDQAGAVPEVVHGLGDQRIALRPVIALPGDEPDAQGSRRAISRKPSCLIS